MDTSDAKPSIPPRHAEIIARFRAGETQQAIGNTYGITRARVQQILAQHGIHRQDSPRDKLAAKAAEKRRAIKHKAREAICQKRYGITLAERDAIRVEFGSKPFRRFRAQRLSMRRVYGKRAWKLSFTEWWALWSDSGLWPEIGTGRYALMRKDPAGVFAKDNSFVGLMGSHTRALHQDPARKAKWDSAYRKGS